MGHHVCHVAHVAAGHECHNDNYYDGLSYLPTNIYIIHQLLFNIQAIILLRVISAFQ